MGDASYVNVLKQYLKSKNLKSTYQLVPEDKNGRSRLVSFDLIVNDKTVTGVGRTKKDAKEEAAELMYNLLIDEERKTAKKNSEERNKEEHVEALIRLCSELSIGEPTFKYESNVDSCHSKLHIVTCSVAGSEVIARGFRKDKVKNQAANMMMHKIKDNQMVFVQFTKLKEEEMKKNDYCKLPDGSLNAKLERQLVIKIRQQQLSDFLKKSKTAYELKMKPESYIDELKEPEYTFQKIMIEMHSNYKLCFYSENHEWVCCIDMFPINFQTKFKHEDRHKAGKYAIRNTLKYMHQQYQL